MRIRSGIAALLALASGAAAGPWHMTYCVTPSGGQFTYKFTLTLVNDDNTWVPGQGVGWIIFGDIEGTGPDPVYSPINDFVADPSYWPAGPFDSLTSSGGGHNGPTLGPIVIVTTDPDHPDPNDPLHYIYTWINWVPTAVGQSISWGGTSAVNVPDGQLLWSNLMTQNNTGPYTYFEVAALRCSTTCYANCDNSTANPTLNANDFQCFLNKFAANDSYANCDGSTAAPVLNANDF